MIISDANVLSQNIFLRMQVNFDRSILFATFEKNYLVKLHCEHNLNFLSTCVSFSKWLNVLYLCLLACICDNQNDRVNLYIVLLSEIFPLSSGDTKSVDCDDPKTKKNDLFPRNTYYIVHQPICQLIQRCYIHIYIHSFVWVYLHSF